MSEATEFYTRQNITPTELNALVSKLSFHDLIVQLKPFISVFSSWRVPGFDKEDLESEIYIVLWKLQSIYDPAKGSFLNLAIRSIKNRMGQLQTAGLKQTSPVMRLRCTAAGCDATIPTGRRGQKCPSCGNRRWDAEHDEYGLVSIQAKQEVNENFDVSGEVLSVESAELDVLLDQLQNDDLWLVERALKGSRVTGAERVRLRELVM